MNRSFPPYGIYIKVAMFKLIVLSPRWFTYPWECVSVRSAVSLVKIYTCLLEATL